MESDTSEEGKRKRGDELDENAFQKSKKTSRSPPKTNDDMMKEMMKLMKALSSDVKEIKLDQRMQTEDTKALREEVKELRREQADYKKELEKLKNENEKMAEEINELKRGMNGYNEKIEKLESEKRKKNIVIQGLTIDTQDGNMIKEKMRKLIEDELGVEITIETAHKLGTKTCLVELCSQENKVEVMKNKSKLKHRQGEKIFINDDLTKEERHIGKIIRQKAKEERSNGKSVKIGFQKLVVNGQIWKWNRQKNILEKSESVAGGTKN